jgi:hypothetical protein
LPDHSAVIGWLLDARDRASLLARIPPTYPLVVAHHVTLKADAGDAEYAPEAREALVVGEANDGKGVQALVVRVNGTTTRPDGSVYHITWSLAPGREAVESNTVIAETGWTGIEPIPIHLTASRF